MKNSKTTFYLITWPLLWGFSWATLERWLRSGWDAPWDPLGFVLHGLSGAIVLAVALWVLRGQSMHRRREPIGEEDDTQPSLPKSKDVAAPMAEVPEKKIDPSDYPEIPVAEFRMQVAYIKVSGRMCVAHRFDGGEEGYVIPIQVLAKLLEGPDFCRIRRWHIVNRRAIASVEHNRAKRSYFIRLKAPYGQLKLKTGQLYTRKFGKWR